MTVDVDSFGGLFCNFRGTHFYFGEMRNPANRFRCGHFFAHDCVLIFAWLMVFIVGSAHTIGDISFRSMVFLILSGLATGASWLCYFKALSLGDVNKVVPIDKSSTVLTVLFAIVILGETQSLVVQLGGVVLILMGTLMMIERKESHGDQQEGTLDRVFFMRCYRRYSQPLQQFWRKLHRRCGIEFGHSHSHGSRADHGLSYSCD